MHIAKKGLRVLGIAESFSSREYSILAGVVMRKDLRIDGVSFSRITVGGMDATEGVLAIYRQLNRRDINIILLSGCVIAWFNIIDPLKVYEETGVPVLVVTYEDSEGLNADISHHFPGDTTRMACYETLGERIPLPLHTGHTLYLRPYGLEPSDAGRLCQDLTLDGKVPEPLRVARLMARSAMRFSGNGR
ncbi:MAG: DUF99 family protein [Methanolinea sp.]|jgi:hypothetical protein|nr:DUF99 family protein [Methanolinea sp.]